MKKNRKIQTSYIYLLHMLDSNMNNLYQNPCSKS